jgi:hypothetical protein
MQMFRILGMEKPEGSNARKTLMSDPLIDAYLKDAFIAVHPDDLARVRKAFRDGYDKEYFSVGNYRILKRDGSPVWINQEAILKGDPPRRPYLLCKLPGIAEHEVALQAQLERQLEEEKRCARRRISRTPRSRIFCRA